MRLLIVDDEIRTRESLSRLISWNDLGIEEVVTAANGIDALSKARSAAPDILLTDVRMPKMDGIVLAENICELYPQCKIIFLSGYSDKEYLKAAIHLKAVTYIEKPIKIIEVKEAILQAKNLLLEDQRVKSREDDLRKDLDESLYLIRQEIALTLIKPEEDLESILQKYTRQMQNLPSDGIFTPACALINWKQGVDESKKDTQKSMVLKLLNNSLYSTELFAAGFLGNESLVLIAAGSIDAAIPMQENIMERILKQLTDNSSGIYTLSIGVGFPANNLKAIPSSYKKASGNANMKFYRGSGKVFYTSTLSNLIDIDNKIYLDFRESLKNDEVEYARAILKKITENIRVSEYENIDHIKDIYFNFVLLLFDVSIERGFVEQTTKSEKKQILEEIMHSPTLYDLESLIVSDLELFYSWIREKNSINKKITGILQYIRRNYADSTLSVQSVSDNIYLSLTYMCAFFKKSTGKTVNEYITEYRMEKAKELLKDQSLKLYDISTRVGLTNVQYFSTLFKKYAGLSPSEFREKYYL